MSKNKRGREVLFEEKSLNCVFINIPSSVIHTCVGRFLKDSIQDYVSLALCTKRLWNYYCENDAFVKTMRFAWKHLNEQTRPTYLLYSNVPLCLRWLWDKERKDSTRDEIVTKYLRAGAAHGNLEIVYTFVPFIESDPFDVFIDVINMLVLHKHQEEALALVEDCQRFNKTIVVGEREMTGLYFVAIQTVLVAPKFYAHIRQSLFKNVVSHDEDTFIRAVLMAACKSDKKLRFKTFEFFWNQTPYIRHARNLLVFLFVQMEGDYVSEIPWIMSNFLIPFSVFSTQEDKSVMQSITFERGEFFNLTKMPSDTQGETICHLSYVDEHGLVGRIRGNFPTRWC
jgi:hypothetical protein